MQLPSGRALSIPACFSRFELWHDAPIQDTYGGKAVLDWKGEPLFAELVILRLIEEGGWQGVWVDTYRRRFRQSLPPGFCSLPRHAESFLEKANGGREWRRGCFDVFAWGDGRYLFVESKRKGHDAINAHQKEWLESALDSGVSLESLLIFEWDISDAKPPRA
jgi:hypothetical protein